MEQIVPRHISDQLFHLPGDDPDWEINKGRSLDVRYLSGTEEPEKGSLGNLRLV